ncbi:MAG: hypothetical protein NTX17_07175 [Candidatus Eisenbacteria bacterium]|nr:hypothetical protein [Candidatus Eisenbacteria bacterium]
MVCQRMHTRQQMSNGLDRYRRNAIAIVLGAMLAILAVHVVRPYFLGSSGVPRFVLGVLPNAAAALALPFLPMVIRRGEWLGRRTLRGFTAVAVLVFMLLLVWEMIQQTVWGIRFDPFDIAASASGAVIAIAIHAGSSSREGLTSERAEPIQSGAAHN